jgi:2,3-bisphosphoglycerate-independent phosphoglycerate mutase
MLNKLKPLVLLVLDGFGYSLDEKNIAIATANSPCWGQLQKDYPKMAGRPLINAA